MPSTARLVALGMLATALGCSGEEERGARHPVPDCPDGCPSPAAGCADPPLREMPPGPPTTDAEGRGQLFESIRVDGFTDVATNTKGTALADVDGDGLVDIVTVYTTNTLRVLHNDGCFRFSLVGEHDLAPRAQVQ